MLHHMLVGVHVHSPAKANCYGIDVLTGGGKEARTVTKLITFIVITLWITIIIGYSITAYYYAFWT